MTNITAHYGWPYPTGSDKAKDLPVHIETLAQSIENTMRGATIPPTANADVRAVASVAARDAYFGAPTTTAAQLALQARGALAIRTDLSTIEQYFAAKSVSNPQGKPTAGWYPLGGSSAIPDTQWKRVDDPTQKVGTLGAGYTHAFEAGAYDGLQARVKNGVLYLSGRVLKSTVASNDVLVTLDPPYRSQVAFVGYAYSGAANFIASFPNGNGKIIIALAGTAGVTFAAAIPLA